MSNNLLILNFAEARQPEYKEKKGAEGGYMEFGYRNDYPEYLLELYNKSAKHNAIIKGKVNYIIGNGWDAKGEDAAADEFIKQPNPYEDLNSLTRKVSTDIEVFGGSYLEVIWSALGEQLVSVSHVDYTRIRTNKDNTQFWYKYDWSDRKEKVQVVNAFNTQLRQGRQILYLKEYRPGLDTYSLPGYMGALNYIESDVEVSKHVLGNAQTGFSASKLVTLPNGEPTPDEKRNIERRFSDRFTGSDGKKLILSFVDRVDQKPIIEDLGQSDLTKEDFGRVDELIQQNIFAGHQIISPNLFGIKTEGQLGGASEMQNAYEIFKNTYANDKQRFLESTFNMLARIKGATEEIKIIPLEPISYQLTEQTLLQIAPKEYLLEKAGIDVSKYNVTPEGGEISVNNAQVNDSLKNLTGRQYQQLMRVVRQFSQGKITKQQAAVMLGSGLGLNEGEINTMLGVDEDPATEDFNEQMDALEDETIAVFNEYGESKERFTFLSDKSIFSSRDLFEEAKLVDRTSDKKILELIKADPLIPNEVLAKAINKTLDFVQARVQYLYDIGAVVRDEITKARTITKPINEIVDAPVRTTIEVRYSYEWKKIIPTTKRIPSTSRPFCQRLMALERFYTRKEIESISARLGYSVFDRGGGWWTKPSGYHSPSCRHEWRANVLVKK